MNDFDNGRPEPQRDLWAVPDGRLWEEKPVFLCQRSWWDRTVIAATYVRRASPPFGRYSFPVPQRIGGCVVLGGWLHTEVLCSLEGGHSSQYQPTDSAAAGD